VSVRFGSLFSGIEAASVAWLPLGLQCAWVAEIDPFACAVLRHRFPDTPNLGDVTKADWDAAEPVEIIIGGSPCQSFSVAGKRLGLDDPRGNLALEFLAVARRVRPRWLVFENVPGLLSLNGGRDFGAFLRLLGECGYGWAYRVLDARHFGVPQRRRRVFVVGHLGDWRPAAAVLFERESLLRNPPTRRETREGIAGTLAPGAHPGGFNGRDAETGNVIAHAVTAHMGRGGATEDGTGRGIPVVPDLADPITAHEQRTYTHEGTTFRLRNVVPVQDVRGYRDKRQNGIGIGEEGDPMYTVTARDWHAVAFKRAQVGKPYDRTRYEPGIAGTLSGYDPEAVALSFQERGRPNGRAVEWQADEAYALTSPGDGGRRHEKNILSPAMAVRRLTPRECERLQGLPDDWTLVPYRGKPAADGPRYRAIGNSMAVPCVRWLGERIALVTRVLAAD
jgi:DNA (cytosine-5)-methyltransferase 1